MVLGYVAAVARAAAAKRRRHTDDAFADWMRDHADWLAVPLPFNARKRREADEDEPITFAPARLRAFADALDAAAKGDASKNRGDAPKGKPDAKEGKPDAKADPSSPLQSRIDWIGDTLSLKPVDRAILGACVRAVVYEPLHAFVRAVSETGLGHDEVDFSTLGRMLGLLPKAVRARLTRARPLVQLGLIEDRHSGDYAPSRTVMRLVRAPTTDPDELGATLFEAAAPSDLEWEDFEHMGAGRDLAADLVGAALDRGETGFNVLLYGEPGTGKTEFAKVLAARLGARPVFVGEQDDEGEEPSRFDRLAHLSMASRLAARAGRTLLVVDEADDLFTGVDEDARALRVGSKVFTNRVVERSAAPTLWITNASDR